MSDFIQYAHELILSHWYNSFTYYYPFMIVWARKLHRILSKDKNIYTDLAENDDFNLWLISSRSRSRTEQDVKLPRQLPKETYSIDLVTRPLPSISTPSTPSRNVPGVTEEVNEFLLGITMSDLKWNFKLPFL